MYSSTIVFTLKVQKVYKLKLLNINSAFPGFPGLLVIGDPALPEGVIQPAAKTSRNLEAHMKLESDS